MKEPKIVNKPITYYSITLWKYRNCYGRQLISVYTDLDKAMRIFLDIVKTNKYEMANIRKNEVWKRDELSEFSVSTPMVKYENTYCFDDFIMEIEKARKEGKTA